MYIMYITWRFSTHLMNVASNTWLNVSIADGNVIFFWTCPSDSIMKNTIPTSHISYHHGDDASDPPQLPVMLSTTSLPPIFFQILPVINFRKDSQECKRSQLWLKYWKCEYYWTKLNRRLIYVCVIGELKSSQENQTTAL